jgi:oxidase EvaA
MNNKNNHANKFGELKNYLENVCLESKYNLKSIELSDQDSWQIRDGVLSHQSKGFFYVTGVQNKLENSEQFLMLYQPQSALTGLILCKRDNDIYVLLQARVEPGNTGVTQFGPTIQSTSANYLRLHGGKSTSYLDNFLTYHPGTNLIQFSIQFDLGRRYFQKSKFHHYLEVDDFLPTEENMIWVSLAAIRDSQSTSNFLNTDLRSLLGIYDWDSYLFSDYKIDLTGSDMSLFMEHVSKIRSKGKSNYRLISLDQLENWSISDYGIINHEQNDPFVSMYEFECTNREVKKWTQPLYCVNGIGLAQLVLRQVNSEYEYLVTIDNEIGITGRLVVLPSTLFYPGENTHNKIEEPVFREIMQSDEGGRFYRNETLNQVLIVDKEIPISYNQLWISQDFFKYLLSTSNLVSIQLRQLSSLIIDILNPRAFGK